DFTPAVALQVDGANVFHRLKNLLDLFVRDLRDLFVRTRAVDVELENRRGVGVLLLNPRRPRVARELGDNGSHLVATALRGCLDVAFEGERDVHVRLPLVGVRAQLVNTADGVDRFFNAFRDLSFDFFGARTRKLDLDVDNRLVGLRHQVEAEVLV